MKPGERFGLTLALVLLVGSGPKAAPAAPTSATAPAEAGAVPLPTELRLGRFGRVLLERPKATPSQVVLLAADGARGPIDAVAREATERGALVVEFDAKAYLVAAGAARDTCTYAAADLEALSQRVQKQLALASYRPPILIGVAAGATLAYAALAEAPPNTFRGAISVGFRPYLEIEKPLCAGHGLPIVPSPREDEKGFALGANPKIEQTWIVLLGESDPAAASQTADLVRRVSHAAVESVPGVGRAFDEAALWLPRFREAWATLAAPAASVPPAAAVADLPLIEVPASAGQSPASLGSTSSSTFAVILSGDGGWAGLDKELAGALAERGIPTAGWNTLSYFWNERTEAGMAGDLVRVLRHYQSAWRRDRVILIGYSYGAEVLPFMASRLPSDLAKQVVGVALLGPGPTTTFEFHVSNWLGSIAGTPTDQHEVLPEIRAAAAKLPAVPLLCLYGEKESDSLCPAIRPPLGRSLPFAGAHHFGGNYDEVADRLLAALGLGAAPAAKTAVH